MFSVSCRGQSNKSFDNYKKKQQAKFNLYKNSKTKDFEEYRRKRNEEYAVYIRKAWGKANVKPAIEHPKDKTVPPLVIPRIDAVPKPYPQPTPIPFDEVVPAPRPTPQPKPVDPIEEINKDKGVTVVPIISFSFFGTPGSVRIDKKNLFKLSSVNEDVIADAWLKLSGKEFTNLVYDCLQLRDKYNLSDWAYLCMLEKMANAVYGKGTNESTLLMAYVYCQSGYKMRFGNENGILRMLFSSKHTIYKWNYFMEGNEKFYPYGSRKSTSMNICNQKYPQEKPLSLIMNKCPILDDFPVTGIEHKSKRNQEMAYSITANKNMLDYYTSYPTSMVGDNFMTRWAMYANMSMPTNIKNTLYPKMKKDIAGKSQLQAVNMILNWVQTGFEYEYDDKVWGEDRAFFPEESLYYPYCDCEDRSILLTRIVRDLLRLKCILIYYPGHLAAAVEFTDGCPTGDYIILNGHRYYITDGTIIGYGAPVGTMMSGMDNAASKVILLD